MHHGAAKRIIGTAVDLEEILRKKRPEAVGTWHQEQDHEFSCEISIVKPKNADLVTLT
jgi:hypothetical protein